MRMTLLAMVGSALLGVGCMTQAADQAPGPGPGARPGPGPGMMKMDVDGDGKVSKKEFMAFHEKIWDGFQKNADGTVDANAMMRHEGMMMRGGPGMMQGNQGAMPGYRCVMHQNACVMQKEKDDAATETPTP